MELLLQALRILATNLTNSQETNAGYIIREDSCYSWQTLDEHAKLRAKCGAERIMVETGANAANACG